MGSHAIQGKLLFAVLKFYFYNKGEGEGVGRVKIEYRRRNIEIKT